MGLWLDSAYPLDKPVEDPGVKRGNCPGGVESTPSYLRENFPDSYVTFQNVAIGEIGSTLQVSPTTPPTPAPCDLCKQIDGTNQPECNGVAEERCKQMNQFENKCQWVECPDTVPTNAPVSSPTNDSSPTQFPSLKPISTPTEAPVTPPALCKNSCYNSSKPWEKLCKRTNCAGCPECNVSPTDAPVNGGDYCCTWNYFNCGIDSFCNECSENCQGECGGTWLLKSAPAMQCIAKYFDCATDTNACCEGLSCQGDGSYKQCLS